MILLDTNVLSEQFRVKPDERVLNWLNEQPLETLYLSAMTVAEISCGRSCCLQAQIPLCIID